MTNFNGTIYNYKKDTHYGEVFVAREAMSRGKVFEVLVINKASHNGKTSKWEVLGKFWKEELAVFFAESLTPGSMGIFFFLRGKAEQWLKQL